jgi:hypothetical protein
VKTLMVHVHPDAMVNERGGKRVATVPERARKPIISGFSIKPEWHRGLWFSERR